MFIMGASTLNMSSVGMATMASGSVQFHEVLKSFAFPSSKNPNGVRFHLPAICSAPFVGGNRPIATFKTAAVASSTSELSSSEKDQMNKKYYFVVANAKFMLDEEEHFKELLFERLCNYEERNKERDFWLVIEPKFLNKFPDVTQRLKRPAVALVSTNGPWITFMKLRLDRVLAESYEAESLEEALASNPTKLEFEKPKNWVAPYPKYEYGWWEAFLPTDALKPQE